MNHRLQTCPNVKPALGDPSRVCRDVWGLTFLSPKLFTLNFIHLEIGIAVCRNSHLQVNKMSDFKKQHSIIYKIKFLNLLIVMGFTICNWMSFIQDMPWGG